MDNPLLALPPLDAIRGFVAVGRRMSITHAAQDLCLTQSAVSRQIQSLEEYFGTPLLVRRHRAIALTEAGEQLFHLASPWLDRLAEYSDSVSQHKRVRPVTITASIGVTSLWILPRLGAFQDTHPHIDVRVSANNRVLDLHSENIDLAIRYARAVDVPAGAVKLFEEAILPVANQAVAARAFKDSQSLIKEVFLELDERARPWLRWSDWLAAAGMASAKPKAYLHFNQYDQIIQAAVEGHGVALGRMVLVLPLLLDGRLVVMPAIDCGHSDYAYWLIDATSTPRPEVKIFRDWVIKEVQIAVGRLKELQRYNAGVQQN